MPNKSSAIGHVPQRTFQICRNKADKIKLLRFGIIDNDLIIDLKQQLPSYGYYICNENKCFEKLQLWVQRKVKRKKGVKRIE